MNALIAVSPILVVALGGLLLMLAEAFGKPAAPEGIGPGGLVVDAGAGRSTELSIGSTAVLLAGALISIGLWQVGPANLPGVSAVAPYFVIDGFTLFFCFVVCLGGALASLLAGGYLHEHQIERGEFFPLIIFSSVGAMALAASGDLLTFFIALETMSLGVYCMIALRRTNVRAVEASLKYFLLGSFAAALALFGSALLYGATGHTDFQGIGAALAKAGSGADSAVSVPVVLVALALLLAGLAFKISAVPFHMWTPDAYEGAPTPATTYMAVSVKSAAFAVLLRLLLTSFGDVRLASSDAGWPALLTPLAILTMTVANMIAGRQSSVKRMLAYSSIAHAGYALVGVIAAAHSAQGSASVLFYLLAYTVSTAGAFGALILCGSRGAEAVSFEDLAGVGRRHPAAALAFSLFLLSLAGVPPTAGFFGKFYVFTAAMDAEAYTLAIVGLLNSILGAYYYLRVLVYMYMREPEPGAPVAKPMQSGLVFAALILSAALVLALGVLPGSSLRVAEAAGLTRE